MYVAVSALTAEITQIQQLLLTSGGSLAWLSYLGHLNQSLQLVRFGQILWD